MAMKQCETNMVSDLRDTPLPPLGTICQNHDIMTVCRCWGVTWRGEEAGITLYPLPTVIVRICPFPSPIWATKESNYFTPVKSLAYYHIRERPWQLPSHKWWEWQYIISISVQITCKKWRRTSEEHHFWFKYLHLISHTSNFAIK
jgi:hypothetical protein